jgi:hypothetical protein
VAGEHSPGPWRWVTKGDWAGYLVAQGGEGDLVFGARREALYDLEEPDALLMEAAPELLELLRLIPVLDMNWTPAEAQAWDARRQALLARIDGEAPDAR